ncbi:putative signal transduction histidine kinase with GAF domain [Fulvimarina pelagi HTCC2506]|uniref:histidine kinase n=2 Tax=Fulvimarina pelagi TaxID=217511 RepID=Q0FZZ8_9HYPH|nr:putative signal transduction histidine kinase with GAF domain [Fulvimarina pelagi HTCC2506]BAT31473.1 possible sensor histidine kinase with GAF domain [Fulvimarina pelagi]
MSLVIYRTAFESARAAALARYHILDTPREDEFDDLAQIASEVCEAPIALVSFLDEHRDFFKAEVGAGRREAPRETSFCRHAVLQEHLTIIPDASKDPRFQHNPLVVDDPKLRFYAGAAIETPDGIPIGTVCVFDLKPRTLNENQGRTLKLLARQARTQLELRRSLAEREEALSDALKLEEKHRLAVERQSEIAREMAHRMKNSLAMVQAIVSQTIRQSRDVETLQEAITTRVSALARAQEVLLSQGTECVDIRDAVEIALGPHRPGEGRFDISGPPIMLDSQETLGLSLGLHELATNAAKYGALSTTEGHVVVAWTQEAGRFALDWRESGGPAVESPTRVGFGSKLMKRVVASYFGGKAQLDFAPSGVVFRLESERKSRDPVA